MNKSHQKRTMKGLLAATAVALVATGCSTHTPFIDYSERGVYASDNTGNIPYIEVGPVTETAYGFVWDSCDDLIEEVLDNAGDRAVANGANAMIGVRWRNHGEGTWHNSPQCTTRWGYFAALGVGGLHPWVRVAELEGRLVYADGDALESIRGSKVDFSDQLEERRQEEMRRRMEERRAQEEAEREAREEEERRQREAEEAAAAEEAEEGDDDGDEEGDDEA